MAGWGWGVHIAGEPESSKEEFSLDQWAAVQPLQVFERRTGKVSPARDLRSLALRFCRDI